MTTARTGFDVLPVTGLDRLTRDTDELTDDGEAVRATVADACAAVEDSVLNGFGPDQAQALRHMLFTIIGDAEARESRL